jgi:pimeloyl-ACP methyl ester carboxylesterase
VPEPQSPAASSPSAPTSTETPFFFTSGDRPVYAVLHAARRDRPGAPGVVVCSSIGLEQLTVYRNEVLAARALADRGLPVLRYHPRGQGDSAGDFADLTVTSLIEDARAAGRELRRRARVERIAWLGVRLGALAAAGALAADGGAALALWEPAERPADYFRAWLRGLLFSQVSHGERPSVTADELLATVERDGRVDVHGYFLHRALLASARGLELGAMLGAWAGPTLLAQVQERRGLAPPHAALADALRARQAAVTALQIGEAPGWHFLQNPAWESPALVDGTAEWFDAVA